MARATIALDDAGGSIAVSLVYAGGYDPTSHAHQSARVVLAAVDKLMRRVGRPDIDPPKMSQLAASVHAQLEAGRKS